MARRPGLRAMPLAAVETLVARERRDQHDLYLPLGRLRLTLGRPLAPLPHQRYRLRLEGEERERNLRFTPTSLGQLCNIAGMPAAFLDRVPASLGIKLLRCLLQMSAQADGRALLLRLKEGDMPRLRAILPASFVRLGDAEVLAELKRAVQGRGMKVAGVSISDDLLYLRLLYPQELQLGSQQQRDHALAGFDVITSETGRRALELRYVVLRRVCDNGMTEPARPGEGMRAGYTGMDRDALQSALQRTLFEAVAWGRSVASRLGHSRSEFVRNPRAELEQIFRQHRLGSIRGRIGHWVLEQLLGSDSLFGVQKWHICQALTAVARDLDHRDRIRLEDAAGAYLLEDTREAA